MALKIFTDTNIIIDFIEQRPFELKAVNQLFEFAEHREIEIVVSESVLVNALYITRLETQIIRLLNIVTVICINLSTFKSAMNSSFKDKEDGILYYGAFNEKVDYFVTRNKKDFAKSSLKQLPVAGTTEIVNMISTK